VNRILSLSDRTHRHLAAHATARGAALFYGFGNFCALAATPDEPSMRRVNRLKGRPTNQVGSITSDPSRIQLAFDWRKLPRGLDPQTLTAAMGDFYALGPIGFRGPAAASVPDHLTVVERGVRTVQHISPGVRCRSNALVAEILDLIGEDRLFITSANRSGHRWGAAEAAHFEMASVLREFGQRPGVVMIGHDDERAARAFHPRHLPCSTSIIAFHHDLGRPALVLERHGSLSVEDAREIAMRHGLDLVVPPTAHTRVPVRTAATLAAA
jgi:tRNA A37 threonylcarbamoyladenosine synthetase subunit TsaC/SUA5/YrdC